MNPVICAECGGSKRVVELLARMADEPGKGCCWLYRVYLPEYVAWHRRGMELWSPALPPEELYWQKVGREVWRGK